MIPDLYAVAFIVPGKCQMDSRLRELLERYDTSNSFQEDFKLHPLLDLSPLFLVAGASIASAPVAGEEGTFAFQVLIHEGTEDQFYGMLEDVLDEMFLPTEAPAIKEKPLTSGRPKGMVIREGFTLQVLKGGKA